MTGFLQCLAGLTAAGSGNYICKLCVVVAPILWLFGTFYITISAFRMYTEHSGFKEIAYVLSMGMFCILCTIFTISNSIHVCL
jgi:hypothetical protein